MRKIKPYFFLAEKLGTFLARLESEIVEELNVYYAGDLNALDVGPITRNAVKGYLKHILGTRVNDVNASYLATRKDRKSTRLNSSHVAISYAVFCLKKTSIQITL